MCSYDRCGKKRSENTGQRREGEGRRGQQIKIWFKLRELRR